MSEKDISQKILDKTAERREPLVKQADQQAASPPKWRSLRIPGDKIAKGLDTASSALDVVRKSLKAASGILSAISSILELLKLFVISFMDALFIFLNRIIAELEKMLDDIRSSGVYFLDLTTYHWDEGLKPTIYDFDVNAYTKQLGQGIWYLDVDEKTKEQTQIDTKENKSNVQDLVKYDMVKNLGEFPSKLPFESAGSQWNPLSQDDLDLKINYKQESYNEFIDVVCNAFLNKDDLPESTILQKALGIKLLDNGLYSSGRGIKEKDMTGARDYVNVGLNLMRSGRPNFGPQGSLHAVLMCISFPDIFVLLTFIHSLWLIGIDLIHNAKEMAKINALVKGNVLLENGRIDAKYDPKTNDISIDTGFFKIYSSDALTTPKRNIKALKQKPYFYGLTLDMVFGDLFDKIQSVLDWLKKLAWKKSVNDPFEVIQKFIKSIQDIITQLIQVIDQIDGLLRFIKLLLTMSGFNMLVVHSDAGNMGLVEQLRSAVGFGGDYKENKEYDDKQAESAGQEAKIKENDKSQNFTEGEITKLRQQITQKGKNPDWKPPIINTIDMGANVFPTDFSIDIQKLYFSLWQKEQDLTELRAQELILWNGMEQIAQDMSTIDPAIGELLNRAQIREEIASLQAQLLQYVSRIAKYDIILAHLNTIKLAAIDWAQWANGDEGQELDAKLIEQAESAQMSTEENELTAEIADATLTGIDIYDNGSKCSGFQKLPTDKAAIQTEYDRYLDGWDVDGDGTIDVEGINSKITAAEQAITDLEEQQTDPNRPQIVDYEQKHSDAISYLAGLEEQKATKSAEYEYELAKYDSIIAYTGTLSAEELEQALEYARDNPEWETNGHPKGLKQYKDDKDESISGSTAKGYKDQIDELNIEIAANDLLISQANANNLFMNGPRSSAASEAIFDSIQPGEYPYGIGTLPAMETNLYADGRLALGARVFTATFGEPPVPGGEHIEAMWGYDELILKNTLTINRLTNDNIWIANVIDTIQAEYDIWKLQNETDQQFQGILADAISVQIIINTDQENLNTLTDAREAQYSAITTEINTLYSSGYSQFLAVQAQWYYPASNLDLRTDDKLYDSGWNNNETYWLEYYAKWDKNKPEVKWVGDEPTVPIVDHAIAKFALEKSVATYKRDLAQAKHDSALVSEQSRAVAYEDRRQQEIVDGRDKIKDWTPDTKMYFAGILVAYGYPNMKDPNYFNFANIAKSFANDPESGVAVKAQNFKKSADEKGKEIRKLFDGMF